MSDAIEIDIEFDGILVVDLADRIEQEGEQEPVITWRIPYSHAETLANALESIDTAREALADYGDAATTYHAREAAGIRMALGHLEGAGLIFKTTDGWYRQVLTCTKCGCTDLRACDPPCSWVSFLPPTCSSCAA